MTNVPNILIIDDDKNFAEVVMVKFRAAGFHIEHAENGEEGILKAQAMNPDLILLDMKMPGMSGADVLTKLQSEERTKNIKMVFLSSVGAPASSIAGESIDHKAAKEIGALGYLRKTDDLDFIVQQVRSYLGAQ